MTQKPQKIPAYLVRWTGFVLGWVSAKGLTFYREELAPLDIDEKHLQVLLTLEAWGPQVQRRLSQMSFIDTATMVRVVRQLAERGLVKQRPHPGDRRAYEICITDSGLRTAKKAEEISDRGTEVFFGILTLEERQEFQRMLLKLAESAPSAARPDSHLDEQSSR